MRKPSSVNNVVPDNPEQKTHVQCSREASKSERLYTSSLQTKTKYRNTSLSMPKLLPHSSSFLSIFLKKKTKTKKQLHCLYLLISLPSTWISVLPPPLNLVFSSSLNPLSTFPFSLPGNSTCTLRPVQCHLLCKAFPSQLVPCPHLCASAGFCLCLTTAFAGSYCYCLLQCPQ